MNHFRRYFLLIPICALIAGCGGSSGPAPVAEQDEIAKYAAEHPESATPNTTGVQ